MAQAPRSSSWQVKLRMDTDFIYDSQDFSGLTRRRSAVVIERQSQRVVADFTSATAGNSIVASNPWAGINFSSQHVNSGQFNTC